MSGQSIDSLFAAIAHGDDTHRAWLEQAIKDHFAGRPVQPSVGKGRKESVIDELVVALKLARTFMVDFEGLPSWDTQNPLLKIDAAIAKATKEGTGA